MTRTYDAEESDGIPAGKSVVYFATACWDRENSTVPEAVASPTFKQEAQLRNWCRETRQQFGDRPRFELRPIARTLTMDSRGKPIPGMHDDKVMVTYEHKAGDDYAAVQLERLRDTLHGATKEVEPA